MTKGLTGIGCKGIVGLFRCGEDQIIARIEGPGFTHTGQRVENKGGHGGLLPRTSGGRDPRAPGGADRREGVMFKWIGQPPWTDTLLKPLPRL